MRVITILTILTTLLTSCGGSDDSQEELPKFNNKELGSFNLVFPDDGLICTEGQDIGNDEVSINFMWNNSENATSYNLQITNLSTNEISNISSTASEKTVTLPKNTQFSWFVTAILGDEEKESSTWNFYSEGTAVENYAPFPARITVSDNGNETVEINWKGNDLDNDIVSYDIYFGTDTSPELVHSTTDDSKSLTQSIIYNTDYYLEIVTTDNIGNKSTAKTTVNF